MVELEHVTFRYGSETEASLKDVSLQVNEGECILLSGPSGCGKTTILRLINGLIPHYYAGELSGSVRVNGKEVEQTELYETAMHTGMVFQNPRSQFYSTDTTGEMAFACENRGMPEHEIYARIDDTVRRLGTEKLMDRSIFQLSDGEKQKIACASVDVAGTEIILLDEPSANLDDDAAQTLREIILEWRKQGRTIIAAEHRIAYLWDLFDRALIMDSGRMIREFSREEADVLSAADLAAMGLRTNIQESPKDIVLPACTETDRTMVIRNFRFAYPGCKEAVVSIPELRIAQNEITAVTGANGAGKTSFLNCLCGLEKHCEGILEYDGKSYDNKQRQKLCYMVMQDSANQLFTESVLEEVIISLTAGTADEKTAALRILEALDLSAFTDRHPQSLSGGQKQRLAIACALASGRKILLLDEPSSGLDYRHMREMAELLKQVCETGTTVLVVTHDCELIRACAGRKITLG
ncbi:MAG: ABC transporter ATP-binding protein [Solobacterium sp.]|nr:ABC transporter ATP-binding protein [Solobacterium sp.]